MQISPQTFAALCYLVLQDHHGAGFINASPGYILEKTAMLDAGYEAYSYLDRQNQVRVLEYLSAWHCDRPKFVQDYELELSNITYGI